MGLVDYSDSESDDETVQQKPTPAAANAPPKKTFQKLLDRSSGAGKIFVNLGAAGAASEESAEVEQPPAKRAKTVGGSRFSSLGSFLPPPKKTGQPASAAAAERNKGSAPAPGVHLRTGAEPAFVRGGIEDQDETTNGEATGTSSGLNLPPPRASRGPSIPEGQKPEEEVKLVGKPLMFKPLSVARKKAPAKSKKPTAASGAAGRPGASASAPSNGPVPMPSTAAPVTEPPPKKKVSLFSMGDDEPAQATFTTPAPTGAYEPIFTSAPDLHHEEETDVTSAYPTYQQSDYQTPSHQPQHQQQDLSSLTSGLSRAAQRDLFGRQTSNSSSSSPSLPANAKIIEFNMEREYAHNEALRASGAQQAYNPVRSIAPGKHSLRQVVTMAQSNKDALEESFARAKGNQRDAAGRYGW